MRLEHTSPDIETWFQRRTFFDPSRSIDDLLELKAQASASISVCLPALNEQRTIGAICEAIRSSLMDTRFVDELVVIDSGSSDATAVEATRAGAVVHPIDSILPEIAAVKGKGEALWRSLAVVSGDIVVYVDADVHNFTPTFVTRLVEPLLIDPSIGLVKAFYERLLGTDGIGGGRVTELLARPLIHLLYPELAAVIQPLAGEYAARTALLRELPFLCGYGVEMGLLIDVLESQGLDCLAQADLGRREHRNRPTIELGPMAFEIAKVMIDRAERSGRAKVDTPMPDAFMSFGDHGAIREQSVPLLERPPMAGQPSSGGNRSGPPDAAGA